MKLTETEINVQTGEEVTIERKLTSEEEAQIMANRAKSAAQTAEAESEATAKATAESKLAALGLTTDDLRALGL
jgi:hypothetical protein